MKFCTSKIRLHNIYIVMYKQITTLLLIGFLIIASNSFANTNDDEQFSKQQILLSVVLEYFDEYHYDPMDYNDEYSEKVFKLYLKFLDQQKRYFLKSDIEEFDAYKTDLDEYVRDLNFEFYELAKNRLVDRQAELKTYIEEILAQPFDFNKEEFIEWDDEKIEFALTKEELKDRWRKILKYQTMTRILDHLEAQEEEATKEIEKSETEKSEIENETTEMDATDETEKEAPKTFEQLEIEMREKVSKTYVDWFVRISQKNDDDYFSQYVNAISQAVDPHSSYFPPEDKENFDISMRGQLKGIGARLVQEGIYTKVKEIIPGSPSARQGELEAEDIILKVAQAEEEAVKVVDMPIDEVVKLIRGTPDTEVRLTVKKLDGSQKIIPIIRDVVILEETYAKSVLINTGERQYGYIDIPSFYSDFSDKNGRNCFKDVKIELEKLNQENIDGLVVDLRNNTGGSLQDVVNMVGLFIEQGPIVQVKSKRGIPTLHNDYDPTIQYGGPLVVLVNSSSASASEIFAAAIQDYNRGIVIGSQSTYGKGTVQRFHGLDRMLTPQFAYAKPLGSLKLTIQKFYRINGGSTQKKGVEPDIILPDQYAEIEYGERLKDNVMPWTEIKPVSYQATNSLGQSIGNFKSLSDGRVIKSDAFSTVSKQALRLKMLRDDTNKPLNFNSFRAENEQLKKEEETFKNLDKKIEGLSYKNVTEDLPALEADEDKMKRNNKWLENLNKDFYILEATEILSDIIL